MRVGTICYASAQGLGILAKQFYDAGVITDPIIVPHASRKTYYDWYPPGTPILPDQRPFRVPVELIKNVDVMLIFEHPFDWGVLELCRTLGTRSVIVPMYECTPRVIPQQPDKWISPSLLDQQYFPGSEFIPIPVEVPWKLRTRATTFVHNAGNFGLRGRNGTKELIEALPLIRSDFNLILRMQESPTFHIPNDSRLTVQIGTIDHTYLHALGDVCIRPEKFNGLSMPLQEAYASGMLVMTSDRFPSNAWLPKNPLIPVSSYSRECVGRAYNEFEEAHILPKDIAATIDAWFGQDILEYSLLGREWAETMSWKVLKPRWMKALES